MKILRSWVVGVAVVAGVASAPFRNGAGAQARPAVTSPCVADSNYQRLAFWVGDWAVYDSTGKRYATQRVRPVVDACAFTADWTGSAGDKGLNLSALDAKSGEWRQVYVSNQVPYPSGVPLRKSDPSYRGPGIRFIPLFEPLDGNQARSRITIMPSSDGVMELFEASRDAGNTWRTVFKAVHRALSSVGP
ncbi:MAG: hypothetical protein ABI625_09960 [bacterium]